MAINPEIRDQAYQFFVEEAADLLQTIESGILTLRQERNTAHVHSLMRAAHSLKGGAASVGLEVIQAIAHRLETIFKALYCDSLELDAGLESQLLQAFDCLRLPLTEQLTQGHFDAEQALAYADPVLVQIEQVLHGAIAETQDYIPSSADLGFNMTTSIFEVDVKQGLDRLVSVLETPEQYEVAGELRAQLEVFIGFSELLGLPGFGSIAQVGLQALEANPDHALEITEQALADLWSARTAVLSGDTQQGGNPSQALLELTQPMQPAPPPVEPYPPAPQPLIAEELAALLEQFDDREGAAQILTELGIVDEMAEILVNQLPLDELIVENLMGNGYPIMEPNQLEETEAQSQTDVSGKVEQSVAIASSTIPSSPASLPNLAQLASIFGTAQTPQAEEIVTLISEATHAPSDAPRHRSTAAPAKSRTQKRTAGSTIRVDSDRLSHINTLMGELSINRNGLALQNDQLRSAIRELTARFSRFQADVEQLRQFSDQMLVSAQRQDVRWTSSNGHSVVHASSANFSTFPPERAQHSANPLAQPAKSSLPNAAPLPIHGSTTLTAPPIHPVLEPVERSTLRPAQGSAHPPSHPPTLHPTFDTLEMDSYTSLYTYTQTLLEDLAQLSEAVEDINLFNRQSEQLLGQHRKMLSQMQEEVLWARMVSLESILNRFPRILRDLSSTYQKAVDLTLNGTYLLIDRSVVEKLYDPLLHLLRNAFDHGIEPLELRRAQQKPEVGQIEIRAFYQGRQVVIEVRDDGRGLDIERIRSRAIALGWLTAEQAVMVSEAQLLEYVFEPGFSTATEVSELSGRGVGLDVVREQLRSLKGRVSIRSTPGQGATFILTLPLTLTNVNLLVCIVGSTPVALRSDGITEMLIPKAEQLKQVGTQRLLLWKDQEVAVFQLSDLLTYHCLVPDVPPNRILAAVPSPVGWETPMLVLKRGERAFALQVDRLVTEQELVVKPFGAAIAPPSYVYGCTVLGDGSLVPVVDGLALLDTLVKQETLSAPHLSETEALTAVVQANATSGQEPPQIVGDRSHTVLVVDDAVTSRRTLMLSLERAGYHVLEARDGQEALEQLQQNASIQLVVCDIEMPNMNGFEFLTQRRQNSALAKIPTVMLTSRSNDKHRWLAMQLGATDYFTKPYLEQEFLGAIGALIQ